MRRNLTKVVLIISLALYLYACDSGPKPVEIEGLATYTDDVTKFSIKYPQNWVHKSTPGARFIVYSNNNVASRFAKYDTEGFPGAKIDLVVLPLDSSITMDSIVSKAKMFPPEIYESAKTTVDGVEGTKLVYSFELNGGMFNGIMIAATKDNKRATLLSIECFDGTYEKYKSNIDEIIASLKLAVASEKKEADTIVQVTEAEPPSQTLETRQGDGFTIGIPDNFGAENIGKAASATKAWSFLGKRRGDSYIKIEIFDSKGKDLKKIVNELKSTLPGAGNAVKANLGGKEAYVFDYKPSNKVKGKSYFAISGNNLYRVTINWFSGEEKDFLPVFEKSISSFKFQ